MAEVLDVFPDLEREDNESDLLYNLRITLTQMILNHKDESHISESIDEIFSEVNNAVFYARAIVKKISYGCKFDRFTEHGIEKIMKRIPIEAITP
jgi:hypothetical protein